jgi:putative spermidine/putrescine transport system permease protein
MTSIAYFRNKDWFDIFPYLFGGTVMIYMVLPILIIVPMSFSEAQYFQFPPRSFSFKWYINFFTDRYWRGSMILSLQVAFITTVLATFLGTLAAFGLDRGQFRGKSVIQAIVLSPRIIPFIITALAAYFFYARLKLIGTRFALITIHTALAAPFVVISLSAALKGFDRTLERAAMGLGASRLQTYLRVTLPVVRPGIISGAILAFMTSFDEVIIAIYICGTSSVTLPKQMWDGMIREIEPTITAVASLLVGVTILLLILGSFLGKGSAAPKSSGKVTVS